MHQSDSKQAMKPLRGACPKRVAREAGAEIWEEVSDHFQAPGFWSPDLRDPHAGLAERLRRKQEKVGAFDSHDASTGRLAFVEAQLERAGPAVARPASSASLTFAVMKPARQPAPCPRILQGLLQPRI